MKSFFNWLSSLFVRPPAPPARVEMASPSKVTPQMDLPLPPVPVVVAGERDLLLARDWKALKGVHPDLIRVVARARRSFSFIVVEGLRTLEKQREMVAQGKSKTMNSRHLTGHAVDLAPWVDKNRNQTVNTDEIDWKDIAAFRRMAVEVQKAADVEKVPIRWGGNFSGFFDGPHFELDWSKYPK